MSGLSRVTLDVLEDYHRSRRIGLVTWKVEVQMLRTFFGYCISQSGSYQSGEGTEGAAQSQAERGRALYPSRRRAGSWRHAIRSAEASTTGAARYEQLRARAMIMLLRHTALRVSDVATLRKDAISWDGEDQWRVFLLPKSQRSPIPPIPSLKMCSMRCHCLGTPRRIAPYYFWNGQSPRRAVVGIAERTLCGGLQEIRGKGRTRPPLPPYPRHPSVGGRG